MKRKFYFLAVLSIAATIYGTVAIYKMLFNNRTPFTIECTGLLLDSTKVYAISNRDAVSPDTIFINFEQAKVLMPPTLGFLYYDHVSHQFILENDTTIIDPSKVNPDKYLFPFCRTNRDAGFSKGSYFGRGEKIPEEILVERGVKYNIAAGTIENRVSIELFKVGDKCYLKAHDDGIGVKYLVQSNNDNQFDLVLNRPVTSDAPDVFYFDNTTKKVGYYRLEIDATTFNAQYKLTDSNNNVIGIGKGSKPTLEVAGLYFSLQPKYTQKFAFILLFAVFIIIAFQVYFLRLFLQSASPVVKALFAIRILLNCIVLLGLPVFLTSYYLAPGRLYFIFLVILLNFSFFISKRFLHGVDLNHYGKGISYFLLLAVAGLIIMMALYSNNESLFGIPVLHVQKLVILLLIFATQVSIFKRIRYGYWLRIGFIIGCSIIISAITKDIGSFIYTCLAFLIVELVRKAVKLKTVFIAVATGTLLTYIFYAVSPDTFSGRKFYRVVAPYTNPASSEIALANQSDRETYSYLIYNLKNVSSLQTPLFNDVTIPPTMRSTCHSDFAFMWNFSFGGVIFFVLFLITVFALIADLVLLLYCASRPIRIREGVTFMLPSTKEAELIRFLLAFSIIAFIYPVASNSLLIPLTGQSIPCLSISNVEVLFLMWLLISLGSVFTNPKYIIFGKQSPYYYGDAKISMRYAISTVIAILILSFLIRWFTLQSFPSSIKWNKVKTDAATNVNGQLLDYTDKSALTDLARNIIGDNKVVNVPNKKKVVLKNIASLFYSGKAYSQTYIEAPSFSNSQEKLLTQTCLDSSFDKKSIIISGDTHPFGIVYSFQQMVNNQLSMNVTNDYYRCVPPNNRTINTDLTAENNQILERHINRIGAPGNIGSIMIVENNSGHIIANSSYPLVSNVNSNEIYYFVGSLKKLLVAYCALKTDPLFFRNKEYGNVSFKQFIQSSDDFYAASALRDLLVMHREELDNILKSDFDLPLYSLTQDSYFDILPTEQDFRKELNRNNIIYRTAIGQQKPYKFLQAVQFYARVASGMKVQLSYDNETKTFDQLSLTGSDRQFLLECLNSVLNGTASVVRRGLENNNINTDNIISKTGTAEAADRNGNSASSFVLADKNHTIGVMLKGTIPQNDQHLSAKDLFIQLIPVLKKYRILNE